MYDILIISVLNVINKCARTRYVTSSTYVESNVDVRTYVIGICHIQDQRSRVHTGIHVRGVPSAQSMYQHGGWNFFF